MPIKSSTAVDYEVDSYSCSTSHRPGTFSLLKNLTKDALYDSIEKDPLMVWLKIWKPITWVKFLSTVL